MSLSHQVERARITLARAGEDPVTLRMRRALLTRRAYREIARAFSGMSAKQTIAVPLPSDLAGEIMEAMSLSTAPVRRLSVTRQYRFSLLVRLQLVGSNRYVEVRGDLPPDFKRHPIAATNVALVRLRYAIRGALKRLRRKEIPRKRPWRWQDT